MKILSESEFQNLTVEEKDRYYSAIKLDHEVLKKRLIESETNLERMKGYINNLKRVEESFSTAMNNLTSSVSQDIENIRNLASQSNRQIINFEGYSYDIDESILLYNDIKVKLTKNESLIFDLLVLNSGKLVPTKSFPIQNVRGFIYNLKNKANFLNISVERNKGYILTDKKIDE